MIEEDQREARKRVNSLRQGAGSLDSPFQIRVVVLNSSPATIGFLKALHEEQSPQGILDFELVVGNDKLARFFNQPLHDSELSQEVCNYWE